MGVREEVAAQAARLERAVGAERFEEITGNRCDGSLPLPKLVWLREERPELFARTRHILISSKDYLIARLTGACIGDVTACSTAGAMDIRCKCWSRELLDAAGAEEAMFPRLLASQERAGGVLPEAAAACGYAPGTPVFAGTGDAGATTLASGIAAPGQYNVNLGTSGWVAAVSDGPLAGQPGVFNLAAMPRGRYINVVPFLNAGNVHGWMAGLAAGFAGRDGADFDRLGELLALTASDFNFERQTLTINKSLQNIKGNIIITPPKTPKSNRTIKIPQFLVDEMQDYIKSLYGLEPDDRIFPISKAYLHHEMNRGAKAAGVKRIRIHDLRHSHVSLLIEMGFSAVAIAERVGHESIDITYRYAHLFPSKQAEMANKLDDERMVNLNVG